jgi:hypothetical protein
VNARTIGTSPKAVLAAVGPPVVGVVLVIVAALLLSGGEQDTVRNIGIGLIVGGPIAGGAAYRARPGLVAGGVPATPDPSGASHLTSRQNVDPEDKA